MLRPIQKNLLIIVISLGLAACAGKGDGIQVDAITPTQGQAGTVVEITGSGLNPLTQKVYIGNQLAPYTGTSQGLPGFMVPEPTLPEPTLPAPTPDETVPTQAGGSRLTVTVPQSAVGNQVLFVEDQHGNKSAPFSFTVFPGGDEAIVADVEPTPEQAPEPVVPPEPVDYSSQTTISCNPDELFAVAGKTVDCTLSWDIGPDSPNYIELWNLDANAMKFAKSGAEAKSGSKKLTLGETTNYELQIFRNQGEAPEHTVPLTIPVSDVAEGGYVVVDFEGRIELSPMNDYQVPATLTLEYDADENFYDEVCISFSDGGEDGGGGGTGGFKRKQAWRWLTSWMREAYAGLVDSTTYCFGKDATSDLGDTYVQDADLKGSFEYAIKPPACLSQPDGCKSGIIPVRWWGRKSGQNFFNQSGFINLKKMQPRVYIEAVRATGFEGHTLDSAEYQMDNYHEFATDLIAIYYKIDFAKSAYLATNAGPKIYDEALPQTTDWSDRNPALQNPAATSDCRLSYNVAAGGNECDIDGLKDELPIEYTGKLYVFSTGAGGGGGGDDGAVLGGADSLKLQRHTHGDTAVGNFVARDAPQQQEAVVATIVPFALGGGFALDANGSGEGVIYIQAKADDVVKTSDYYRTFFALVAFDGEGNGIRAFPDTEPDKLGEVHIPRGKLEVTAPTLGGRGRMPVGGPLSLIEKIFAPAKGHVEVAADNVRRTPDVTYFATGCAPDSANNIATVGDGINGYHTKYQIEIDCDYDGLLPGMRVTARDFLGKDLYEGWYYEIEPWTLYLKPTVKEYDSGEPNEIKVTVSSPGSRGPSGYKWVHVYALGNFAGEACETVGSKADPKALGSNGRANFTYYNYGMNCFDFGVKVAFYDGTEKTYWSRPDGDNRWIVYDPDEYVEGSGWALSMRVIPEPELEITPGEISCVAVQETEDGGAQGNCSDAEFAKCIGCGIAAFVPPWCWNKPCACTREDIVKEYSKPVRAVELTGKYVRNIIVEDCDEDIEGALQDNGDIDATIYVGATDEDGATCTIIAEDAMNKDHEMGTVSTGSCD